jgi:hypothetical protein
MEEMAPPSGRAVADLTLVASHLLDLYTSIADVSCHGLFALSEDKGK